MTDLTDFVKLLTITLGLPSTLFYPRVPGLTNGFSVTKSGARPSTPAALRRILGRTFRPMPLSETASHPEAGIRDVVSAKGRKGKAHPIPSIKSERAWLSPLAHLGKRNQLGISPARRSILTSLRKATLREDHVAFMLPSKELASMHELLQHVFARRFIAPFALRKQHSALAIVNNQVDFFLRMRAIVRPPPAPDIRRNHIELARASSYTYCLHISSKTVPM